MLTTGHVLLRGLVCLKLFLNPDKDQIDDSHSLHLTLCHTSAAFYVAMSKLYQKSYPALLNWSSSTSGAMLKEAVFCRVSRLASGSLLA